MITDEEELATDGHGWNTDKARNGETSIAYANTAFEHP